MSTSSKHAVASSRTTFSFIEQTHQLTMAQTEHVNVAKYYCCIIDDNRVLLTLLALVYCMGKSTESTRRLYHYAPEHQDSFDVWRITSNSLKVPQEVKRHKEFDLIALSGIASNLVKVPQVAKLHKEFDLITLGGFCIDKISSVATSDGNTISYQHNVANGKRIPIVDLLTPSDGRMTMRNYRQIKYTTGVSYVWIDGTGKI